MVALAHLNLIFLPTKSTMNAMLLSPKKLKRTSEVVVPAKQAFSHRFLAFSILYLGSQFFLIRN